MFCPHPNRLNIIVLSLSKWKISSFKCYSTFQLMSGSTIIFLSMDRNLTRNKVYVCSQKIHYFPPFFSCSRLKQKMKFRLPFRNRKFIFSDIFSRAWTNGCQSYIYFIYLFFNRAAVYISLFICLY